MKLILNFAFVLFAILRNSSVLGLECHVCNSSTQPSCGSVSSGSIEFLQNCTAPKDQSCRIQEQWVDFDVTNQKSEQRIIRQCASNAYEAARPCYYRTGFGARTNVCNCAGDGCNPASRISAASALIVALLLLLVAKYL